MIIVSISVAYNKFLPFFCFIKFFTGLLIFKAQMFTIEIVVRCFCLQSFHHIVTKFFDGFLVSNFFGKHRDH